MKSREGGGGGGNSLSRSESWSKMQMDRPLGQLVGSGLIVLLESERATVFGLPTEKQPPPPPLIASGEIMAPLGAASFHETDRWLIKRPTRS